MADKLYYNSRSPDKLVGKGTNEHINNFSKYDKLNAYNDWRKCLSNFWVAPFTINDLKYNTVEHMFQGTKISLEDPILGAQFALNSGSKLSKESGNVAQENRKIRILSAKNLIEWEKMKDNVMYVAMRAKFSQNKDMCDILLATGAAELWHGVGRVPPTRQFILEKVRSELSS
jgi:ribA/ribD-fused uncharacterized protein